MRLATLVIVALFATAALPGASAFDVELQTVDAVLGSGPIGYVADAAQQEADKAAASPVEYVAQGDPRPLLMGDGDNPDVVCWAEHYYGVREVRESHLEQSMFCTAEVDSEETFSAKDLGKSVRKDARAAYSLLVSVAERIAERLEQASQDVVDLLPPIYFDN